MTRSALTRTAVALFAVWLLGLLATTAVSAQEQPKTPKIDTQVSLGEPRTTRTKGQLVLSATLFDADGKTISDESISFYQKVELLGPRESFLGSATTDSTGVAGLVYEPAEQGRQTIVARFSGTTKYAASNTNAVIEVREAVPPFESRPLPLASIREWFPIGLGTAVLATWAVLLGGFLNTVLGIRAVSRTEATTSRKAATVPVTTSES